MDDPCPRVCVCVLEKEKNTARGAKRTFDARTHTSLSVTHVEFIFAPELPLTWRASYVHADNCTILIRARARTGRYRRGWLPATLSCVWLSKRRLFTHTRR